jgi:hypothetical protein
MVSETRIGFGVRLANAAGDAHDPAIADPSSARIGEPDMPLRMPLAASMNQNGPPLCCTLQPNHSPSSDSNWAEDSSRTSAIRSGVAMDWTDFDADNQATIMLSLISKHGRSTPLVWLTVDKATLNNHRNAYEYRVLVQLLAFARHLVR